MTNQATSKELNISIEGYKDTFVTYIRTNKITDVFMGNIIKSKGKKVHCLFVYVVNGIVQAVRIQESLTNLTINLSYCKITGLPESKEEILIKEEIEIIKNYIETSKPATCNECSVGRSYRARRNSRYKALHENRLSLKKQDLKILESKLLSLMT